MRNRRNLARNSGNQWNDYRQPNQSNRTEDWRHFESSEHYPGARSEQGYDNERNSRNYESNYGGNRGYESTYGGNRDYESRYDEGRNYGESFSNEGNYGYGSGFGGYGTNGGHRGFAGDEGDYGTNFGNTRNQGTHGTGSNFGSSREFDGYNEGRTPGSEGNYSFQGNREGFGRGQSNYGGYGEQPNYGVGNFSRGSSYGMETGRDNTDWGTNMSRNYEGNRDSNLGTQGNRSSQLGGFKGKGPKNYRRSNDRIIEDINDRLTDDHSLDASDIEAKVEGQEIILTGTVADRYAKRRAEEIAESVSGVTNVENRIKVKTQSTSSTETKSSTEDTGRSASTQKEQKGNTKQNVL